MLWRCWFGGRKGIAACKNRTAGCWCGYLSGARCSQLMPLPVTVPSCFSKIEIGFTFLVPAHPGSPGQRAVKRMCVNVVCTSVKQCIYNNNDTQPTSMPTVVLITDPSLRDHLLWKTIFHWTDRRLLNAGLTVFQCDDEWVLNKAGVKRELLDAVKARKLAYYGHTMRKQESCLEKEIM